jgi:hypothetical protein
MWGHPKRYKVRAKWHRTVSKPAAGAKTGVFFQSVIGYFVSNLFIGNHHLFGWNGVYVR